MFKVLAGLLVGLALFIGLFRLLLLRGFRAPRVVEHGTPADIGFEFSDQRIRTRDGKHLHTWFLPGDPQAPCVIVMHGWGGNAEVMLPAAKPFRNAGLSVLLLDARGHGKSDADGYSSLPKFAEDVEACIDWLESQPHRWNGRVILLGHSVGAAAVLLVASRDRRVDAVISIAAFSHPRTMMQRYLRRFPAPLRAVIIQQVQQIIGHPLNEIAPLNTIRRIECPVLVAHGLADTTVPATEAQRIVEGIAADRVELVLIEGAGHDSMDSLLASGEQLLSFLRKSVELQRPSYFTGQTEPPPPPHWTENTDAGSWP